MEVLMYSCLAIIGIAIALCYPPLFVVILVLCIPLIGIVPLILYLILISIIYGVKRGRV